MPLAMRVLRPLSDRRKLSYASSSGSSATTEGTHRRSRDASLSSARNISDSGEGNDEPTPVKRRFTYTGAWSWAHRDKIGQDDARGPTGLRLLRASAEPLIDLIFVHGLRGGSIKTWRKGSDPSCFWPQCWLPSEPGFENVNIYSYGYDSDWASSEPSILDVHDFGRNLLEDMRNSPYLRNSHERPIILVGHSMGGVVIKKAFILARDVPDFEHRIRCIFFLATPHRGSDYAAILNDILAVSGILFPRQYISDLTTGSTSIQLINDAFGKYAHDLPIFSFYETLKTALGVSSILVVDKSSAVLGPGFKNERVQYINANHRDICKYSSVEDPNYLTIKNALAAAVADLLRNVLAARKEESIQQLRAIRTFLGVSEGPDEQHQKVEGSCEWIDAREDYCNWRDFPAECCTPENWPVRDKTVSIFWVHANPGTGKTVLASHVICQLQAFRLECAYHYFHLADKNSRSLGTFLRSIAYQMATSNAAIRERLFKLLQEGTTFDMDDSRIIWTKLFRKGIFQVRIYSPQYWVVDALDECSKYQELFAMLKGESPGFPLRIFITSRIIGDMQRLQRSTETSASLVCIQIPVQASIDDIRRYIESRIDGLPLDNAAEREELASTILGKSNACFLWVRLVMDELESVYSNEGIVKVLERIPEGMLSYYERTMNTMAANTLEKHISKAVLMWTAASARNLTLSELSQALKLDINTVLPSAKSAVEGLCGQLVSIDRVSGLVDLIHPTACEFLFSEAAGEFAISRPLAHERIAMACLQLLCSNEMRPPRTRRFLTQARPPPSPFLDYALTQFSEHIASASSENDRLLAAMDQFFRTNALSWIERLALKGNLHALIRASKNLKAYLDRRAKYQSPLGIQVRNIDDWSIDLTRLVTQFGEALLRNPPSIYFLIPPLCPSGSAIYRQFGKKPDSLIVTGKQNVAWADCIAYVSFGDDAATAVSCGENMIAVSMASGDVNLYNHRSCQKQAVIHHKQFVDLVHLVDDCVVLCTIRSIVLLDLDGKIIWENKLRFRCLHLSSSIDSIIAVSQNGHLLRWDRVSGALLEDKPFEYRNSDAGTSAQHNRLTTRVPHVASISPDMEMLALGYRGGAVCLWEVNGPEFVDWARDEAGRQASAVLFNPNPNINLFLVIYTDHGMALFDTWSATRVHTQGLPQSVGLLSASCSPDGRTLVTTDTLGNMRIWDFESLSLLYHVLSHFPGFRVLNFTSDGSCVVDVMDSGMRIWSPAVLVRKAAEKDASISDDANNLAVTEGEYESRNSTKIKTLCAHPSLPIIIAGKDDGQVLAFNTGGEGADAVPLYTHQQRTAITKVAINTENVVASIDDSGIVQVWSLASSLMEADRLLFQAHAGGLVKQLCFSANGEYLLVATTKSDSVYRIDDTACVGMWAFEAHERKMWRWLILPPAQGKGQQQQQFSLLADGVIRSYDAQSFPQRADGESEIHIQYTLDEGAVVTEYLEAVVGSQFHQSPLLALEVRHHAGLVSSSTTFLFDLTGAITTTQSTQSVTLTPLCPELSKRCKHLVGFSAPTKRLMFIHQNSWLCSIDMQGLRTNRYTEHFFVPEDYLAVSRSSSSLSPVKTAEDDVVFCLHGELISVRNGMKFQENVVLEE
ncbi:hypothetical protein VTK56DRAFT_8870 [Thermocarpiscus australiensis]